MVYNDAKIGYPATNVKPVYNKLLLLRTRCNDL